MQKGGYPFSCLPMGVSFGMETVNLPYEGHEGVGAVISSGLGGPRAKSHTASPYRSGLTAVRRGETRYITLDDPFTRRVDGRP